MSFQKTCENINNPVINFSKLNKYIAKKFRKCVNGAGNRSLLSYSKSSATCLLKYNNYKKQQYLSAAYDYILEFWTVLNKNFYDILKLPYGITKIQIFFKPVFNAIVNKDRRKKQCHS